MHLRVNNAPKTWNLPIPHPKTKNKTNPSSQNLFIETKQPQTTHTQISLSKIQQPQIKWFHQNPTVVVLAVQVS